MCIQITPLPHRLSFSRLAIVCGERTYTRYAYFAPQNPVRFAELPSIMQASLLVLMETIRVRLRSELFGLYQFRAHLVFPSRSPSSTTTTCVGTASTSILTNTPPLIQFLHSRTIEPSLQEKPKDLGKHGYRIEQRHFATGRKSHGNLKTDVYTSKRKLKRFLLARARFKNSICVNRVQTCSVISMVRNCLLHIIHIWLIYKY